MRRRQQRSGRYPLKARLLDLLVWPMKGLVAALSRMPLRTVQRLGAALGTLWFHLLPIRRRLVLENLGLAFPDLTARARWRIAAESYRSLATTVLETFWVSGRSLERISEHLRVEGFEHYEAAVAEGRGVVAVTAHLGNFDLLACSQAMRGVPLRVVTKELSARGLGELWMSARSRTGLRLEAAKGSGLRLIRALRRGEVVGLVVDQRTPPAEGGELVPFFDRPAWTTVAPHVLASRTGAAIIPVHAFRDERGRHHIRIHPELPLGESGQQTMRSINRLIEQWVREHPGQYLWHHRRWLMEDRLPASA